MISSFVGKSLSLTTLSASSCYLQNDAMLLNTLSQSFRSWTTKTVLSANLFEYANKRDDINREHTPELRLPAGLDMCRILFYDTHAPLPHIIKMYIYKYMRPCVCVNIRGTKKKKKKEKQLTTTTWTSLFMWKFFPRLQRWHLDLR